MYTYIYTYIHTYIHTYVLLCRATSQTLCDEEVAQQKTGNRGRLCGTVPDAVTS